MIGSRVGSFLVEMSAVTMLYSEHGKEWIYFNCSAVYQIQVPAEGNVSHR